MSQTFKIVNLGLPKTGTTTLTRALRRAKVRTVDWRIHRRQSSDPQLVGKHLGTVLYRDYFDHGDPLRRLSGFRGFNELSQAGLHTSLWPQTDWGLLDAIQRHHPDTRFLLNMRDPAATAASIMRWGNMGAMRLPNTNIPGLPKGYGHSEAELARWILGHYMFCERVFAGSSNFLAFDIDAPDARESLARFLDLDMPWWGIANQNPAPPA